MVNKILITGGAGFIGSVIVNKLYENGGFDITVLDNLNEQIHGKDLEDSYLFQSIQGKCNFIKASVTDVDCMKEIVPNNDVIIHLAAETGTGQSMYQINQYNETNIMGLSNLFQAISLTRTDCRVKKIILSSSRSVYGEGKYKCANCGVVFPRSRDKEKMEKGDFNFYCNSCGNKLSLVSTTEDSEINPSSLYAFTKYAQEMMIKTMCSAMNIDYTILRFQNVYGVGQSLKNPYTGILSIFSSLMLDDKTVNIFEDGLESRDFVNVYDIADGVIACINNRQSNGHIINLGSGLDTSVIEIAQMLKKHYNSRSEIKVTGDYRIGDIAHNRADISKARTILGFIPKISLDEGLREFCEWVKEQKTDNSKYEQSLIEMEKVGMFIRRNE